MDRYTKVVLTVIAVALGVVALRIVEPQEANAAGFSLASAPTYGDILALRDIKDTTQRKEAYLAILRRIPLVRVQGGSVDAAVSGSVEIDR